MKIHHIFFIIILFILFFVEFPLIMASRSLDRISDFSHIIIFALIAKVLLSHLSWLKTKSKIKQLLYISLFIVLISFLIESIQFFFHRTPDIGDIKRNLIGGIIGFIYTFRVSFRGKYYVRVAYVLLIFLVSFEFYLVARAIVDDTNSRINFPVLSDFESSLEVDRWEGRAEYIIVDNVSKEGEYSLQVIFKKDKFSDISLIHFPGDWSAYNEFTFSVFNPINESVTIYTRIYDREYNQINSVEKDDRYNKFFKVVPGWNDIVITLQSIRTAPKLRKMDLKDLTRIRIFTEFLDADRQIYFDNFRLK